MFDRIVKEMRDKIRNREYILTIHGEEEMDNDSLSIYDLEHRILTGRILERQKDLFFTKGQEILPQINHGLLGLALATDHLFSSSS
ncbi:MAG: hypothetical protein A3G93_15260 [Nitrospinae bacterium RIFCSPLOWO2_12_FULL_45_22]|nr:MAG: hypothetical protein A3G93_15260 [Nitrospinae bacterium RIFCSPLOWO2_12_FULL_45_22]